MVLANSTNDSSAAHYMQPAHLILAYKKMCTPPLSIISCRHSLLHARTRTRKNTQRRHAQSTAHTYTYRHTAQTCTKHSTHTQKTQCRHAQKQHAYTNKHTAQTCTIHSMHIHATTKAQTARDTAHTFLHKHTVQTCTEREYT